MHKIESPAVSDVVDLIHRCGQKLDWRLEQHGATKTIHVMVGDFMLTSNSKKNVEYSSTCEVPGLFNEFGNQSNHMWIFQIYMLWFDLSELNGCTVVQDEVSTWNSHRLVSLVGSRGPSPWSITVGIVWIGSTSKASQLELSSIKNLHEGI